MLFAGFAWAQIVFKWNISALAKLFTTINDWNNAYCFTFMAATEGEEAEEDGREKQTHEQTIFFEAQHSIRSRWCVAISFVTNFRLTSTESYHMRFIKKCAFIDRRHSSASERLTKHRYEKLDVGIRLLNRPMKNVLKTQMDHCCRRHVICMNTRVWD